MSKETLLEEIKNAIVNNGDLTTILLKCQLLAHNIPSPNFLAWVNNELNGYQESDIIPSYRCIRVSEIKANVINDFGVSLIREIPFGLDIPEPYSSQLYCTYLRNSVSELLDFECKCKNDNKYNLKLNLHGAFFPILENCFESGDGSRYYVQSAWQLFSGQCALGVLTSIRSKVLEFICQLSEAIECDLTASENMEEKTTQIFNSTIFSLHTVSGDISYSGNNIAIGEGASVKITEAHKAQLTELWEQINVLKSKLDDDATELAEYLVELKKEIDDKITCPAAIRKTLRAIKSIISKAGEIAIEHGIDQCINMLSQYF
ncbi:MAG: hypothetical protein K2L31_09125 [Muribaculum sp.]|nr:hypothetical protein [Muribaculum sp.]